MFHLNVGDNNDDV